MIVQEIPIVLAFGANLSDRATTIQHAWDDLKSASGIRDFRPSKLYRSIAVTEHGIDPHAPEYLNAVALAHTTLTPEELLSLTQSIENKYGRVRKGQRWAPRTLDIDIILYGGKTIKTEDLQIPHPRAHERDFVLVPWNELDTQAALPGRGTVSKLLQQMKTETLLYDASREQEGRGRE